MRLWTQNGLLLCSQLKFLGTWFQAAVLCCDFCGVRSVATLQLLGTPNIQPKRKTQYFEIQPKQEYCSLKSLVLKIGSTKNIVFVPVTPFATGPSSQQSPLQSLPPHPKRSDEEAIFRFLAQGSMTIHSCELIIRMKMWALTPGRDFLRACERWSDCSKIWEADCFTVPWKWSQNLPKTCTTL